MHKTKKFCCQYYHDGSWWYCEIDAYGFADAEARCKRLGLKLDGELKCTVPGWLAWLGISVCGIRNFFPPTKKS